jgi:hypothetical protein
VITVLRTESLSGLLKVITKLSAPDNFFLIADLPVQDANNNNAKQQNEIIPA